MLDVDLSKKIIRFTDCSILRDHRLYKDDIWFCDGKIIDPEKTFYYNKLIPNETISLNGSIVAPGFIDIQTNGGFGIDFTYDLLSKPEGLDIFSKGVLAHGVTSFCPTIITTKPEVYHPLLELIKKRKGGQHGAEILGVHLEGPFINPLKKGAHAEEDILGLVDGIKTVKDIYGNIENVKIITLAPEIDNALPVINWLTTTQDIVVSLGHTMADLSTCVNALGNGATLITHLYNAMPSFHHRNPGLVGLLGLKSTNNPPYFGIISDGIHAQPTALNIAYKAHPNGIILITDAISAMGFENGVHYVGGKHIEISGKSALLAGTNTLCGSLATMNDSLKYFMHAVECTKAQALEAVTLHPAKALGIATKKGTLNFASDADFVILDQHLNIISTWIAGKLVYENPAHAQETQLYQD